MTMTPSRAASDIDMKRVIIGKAEHLPLVCALEAATFTHPASREALGMFFGSDGAFCALCLVGGELASYCTVVTVLDEAQIINVATAEKHKGRGYGTEVISLVLEEARKRKIVSVSLEVRESNAPAIGLYEKMGFKVAGKRKGFYTQPLEDALVMIKNLD